VTRILDELQSGEGLPINCVNSCFSFSIDLIVMCDGPSVDHLNTGPW